MRKLKKIGNGISEWFISNTDEIFVGCGLIGAIGSLVTLLIWIFTFKSVFFYWSIIAGFCSFPFIVLFVLWCSGIATGDRAKHIFNKAGWILGISQVVVLIIVALVTTPDRNGKEPRYLMWSEEKAPYLVEKYPRWEMKENIQEISVGPYETVVFIEKGMGDYRYTLSLSASFMLASSPENAAWLWKHRDEDENVLADSIQRMLSRSLMVVGEHMVPANQSRLDDCPLPSIQITPFQVPAGFSSFELASGTVTGTLEKSLTLAPISLNQ